MLNACVEGTGLQEGATYCHHIYWRVNLLQKLSSDSTPGLTGNKSRAQRVPRELPGPGIVLTGSKHSPRGLGFS